ncbi:phenylacetate--CoA ligase family protein [Novosphingobium sp. Fuku2-ISO-50]|uniref:phenylacetate--CoA ligase family protein n=1 Tax=Novosphingobium sp. Fuku2-ISO-50 TaxID=1739114 RepID=UPI000B056D55|nr:phenylacetate--CoA ligase family protein [Novosphingobium sp. Fuku2-ISO-50]MDR3488182.1 phenylacetate--CoA ligase family protein [Bradyrhizobium sp.]
MALRSAIPAIGFPAIFSGRAAELLALQRQYDESQFWPPDKMRSAQFAQLSLLIEHCARTVPFYADRLRRAGLAPGKRLTEAAWRRLPILTRADVGQLGEKLYASSIPAGFGPTAVAASGGSSGVPVRVRKTALDNVLWESINIREELWHRDRPEGDLVRLRGIPDDLTPEQMAAARSKDGLILPDWGHPANLFWKTGRLGLLSPKLPLAQQVAFIRKMQPAYLYTFPSYLRLIISHIRDKREKVGAMRAVFTASEQVSDELREDCLKVFGCKIVENYTSGETGYIALQCPETTNLHVQSEIALVEILNADGGACRPGEIGRVVLTPLHNFAMPLLRYEIGDEAEVAQPCSCGRGLLALKRVVGRADDYFLLANGERRRADISHYRLSGIPAIREFRLVQRSFTQIVLQIVASRALTGDELSIVENVVAKASGGLFETVIEFVPDLDRTAAGKLRAFKCEVVG